MTEKNWYIQAKITAQSQRRWIDANLPDWYTEKRSFLRGFQQ
jgi:hypothetical protein